MRSEVAEARSGPGPNRQIRARAAWPPGHAARGRRERGGVRASLARAQRDMQQHASYDGPGGVSPGTDELQSGGGGDPAAASSRTGSCWTPVWASPRRPSTTGRCCAAWRLSRRWASRCSSARPANRSSAAFSPAPTAWPGASRTASTPPPRCTCCSPNRGYGGCGPTTSEPPTTRCGRWPAGTDPTDDGADRRTDELSVTGSSATQTRRLRHEKRDGQTFVVDLTLGIDTAPAAAVTTCATPWTREPRARVEARRGGDPVDFIETLPRTRDVCLGRLVEWARIRCTNREPRSTRRSRTSP